MWSVKSVAHVRSVACGRFTSNPIRGRKNTAVGLVDGSHSEGVVSATLQAKRWPDHSSEEPTAKPQNSVSRCS